MDLSQRRSQHWSQRWNRVIGAVVIGGLVGVSAVGFWRYAHHDPPELIDTSAVADVADSACMTMRTMVVAQAPQAEAGIEARIRAIRAQDVSVAAMVARVRELGEDTLRNDLPSEKWLLDWENLSSARERYADTLAQGGEPVFHVPESNGIPITDRMNEVGLTCQVPEQLLLPG